MYNVLARKQVNGLQGLSCKGSGDCDGKSVVGTKEFHDILEFGTNQFHDETLMCAVRTSDGERIQHLAEGQVCGVVVVCSEYS